MKDPIRELFKSLSSTLYWHADLGDADIGRLNEIYQAYCEERVAKVEALESLGAALEQLAASDFENEQLKDKLAQGEFQRERLFSELDELRKEISSGELGVFEVADWLRGFRKAGAA